MKMNRTPFLRQSKNRKAAKLGRYGILAGSAALLAAVLLPLQKAEAVIYYWDTASGTWQDGLSWSDTATSGGITGVVPLATDSVFFNQSSVNGAETISLNAATDILGMTFNNTGTTTLQSDSVTSRVLTLGTGGMSVDSGAGAVTIGNATNGTTITLGGAQSWTNNSTANALTIVNALTLGANQLTIAGAGTTTISGTVGGTVAAGSVQITVGTGVGSGSVLNLTSAANAFAGDIAVNGGTLVYSQGTATTTSRLGIGTGAVYKQILLSNNGAFRVSTLSFNDNIPSATNKGAGVIINIAGTGGTLNVDTGLILTLDDGTGGGTATTASQLQGSGTLTKTGLGVLSLGNSTVSNAVFTGQILVSTGVLRTVSLTTGVGFGSTTANTVISSGAALDLSTSTSTSAEPLTISGTGAGASATYNANAGGATNAIYSSGSGGSFAGPITLAAPSTIGSGGSAGVMTLSGGITGAFNLTINNLAGGGTTLSTGAVNIGGNITNSGAGAGTTTISSVIGALVTGGVTQNSATSQLTISGTANTYTGPTTITQGTLSTGNVVVAAAASGLGNSTNRVILGGASTKGTLQYTGGAATYTRNFTINAGGGDVNSTANTLTLLPGASPTYASIAVPAGGFGLGTGASVATAYIIIGQTSMTGAMFTGTGTLTINGNGGVGIVRLSNSRGVVTTAVMPININSGQLNYVASTAGAVVTNVLGTGAITITPTAAITTLNLFTAAVTGGASSTFGNPVILADAAGTVLITIGGGVSFTNTVTGPSGANTPTLRLSNTNGSLYSLGFSGGFTGKMNLELQPSFTNAPITLSGTAVNNTGSITNVGTTISATSIATISAAVGSNVTGLTQNGLNAFTISGGVTANAAGLPITSSNTGLFTLSGAITGTSNLTIQANSTGNIVFGAAGTVNNIGTVTNSGTNFGSVTISNPIGANVTGVIQNSATSPLILSGNNSAFLSSFTDTLGVLQFNTTNAMTGFTGTPNANVKISVASGGILGLAYPTFTATNVIDLITNANGGTYSNVSLAATGAAIGLDTTAGSASFTSALANAAGTTSFGFVKLGTNTLTLGTANTYTGPTWVQNGTLSVGSINSVVGGVSSSSLGVPTTVPDGTISLGFGTTTGVISYSGAGGETTDRVINLAGTTGGGGIDNSGAGALTISNPVTFTGVGAKTLTVSGASNITFGSAIGTSDNFSTGTRALTIAKTGAGTVTLSGANSAKTLAISGGIVDTGAGSLTLSNVGAVTIAATGNATINGNLTLAGVAALQTGAAAANGADIGATVAGVTLTINAVISGGDTNGIDFWSAPTGVTVLTGANTWSGQSAVAGQTVSVGSLNSVATNAGLGTVHSASSNFGSPTLVPQGTIQLGNAATAGTLRYTGTGENTDRVINLQGTTGAVAIDQSGSGLLKFVSANTATGAGIKVLTLQGSTAGTGEIAGAIVDNSATNTTGVAKAGSGTWTLSGVNTYTGPTTVNAGNLIISQGAGGGLLGNTGIVINNGGMLSPLAGFTVGNTVTAATGGRLTLNAGGLLNLADGTIGNFNLVQNPTFVGNAATFAGGAINFDIGSTLGSNDQIDVRLNNVTSAGFATSSGATGVAITPAAGVLSLSTGAYTLITAAAASTLNNANFFLASPNLIVGGTLYNLTLSGTTGTEVLNVATGGAASAPNLAYWQGTQLDGKWNTLTGGSTTNWASTALGNVDTFALPASNTNVIFSANTATNLSTTIEQNFTINSLNFNNAAGATIASGTGPNTLTINAAALNGNPVGSGITVLAGSGANTISAPVLLGGSQTWTNNSSNTLAISGPLGDAGSNFNLSLGGTGTIALTNATNTYGGSTIINGGTLQVSTLADGGSPSSIGQSSNAASNLVFGGNGTLAYVGGTVASNRGFTINAGITATINVAGSANLSLAGATSAATTGLLIKTGTGTLTLSGANTYTGNTTLSAGTLNITGSLTGLVASSSLAYGDTAGNTIVNISGNVNSYLKFTGANIVGSVAVMNQTSGSVTIVPTNSADVQWVAKTGYGSLNITGGTFNTGRFDLDAQGGTNAVGTVYVGGGGTFNNNVGDWLILARGGNNLAQLTVGPGGTLVRSAVVTAQLGVTMDGTNSTGVLNIAGGTLDSGTRAIQFGFGASAAATGNTGFVNLAGGTLSVGLAVSEINTAGSTAEFFNFAGGTLKLNAALASFIPATSIAGHTSTSTIFAAITNNNNANTAFNTQIGGASNFTGGLTVDTNGNPTTFGNAFTGATGFGVTQANIGDVSLLAGNSGYIGAPAVTFSAPTAPGADPASGYAVIDPVSGKVTGIVITNPGVYGSGETPTITFSGGGGTIAAFAITSLATANGSGGLTKIGLGTLTLTGANTYTGGTTVTGGTLALGVSNTLASTGNVTASNTGTFDVGTFTNTVGTVTLKDSGLITGSTGVLTSTTSYELQGGTVNFTNAAGGFGGAVAVNKTTAGLVTLVNAGLGSFNNAVNVNGGTLVFDSSAQLGAGGVLNTTNISGGTLRFTPGTTTVLPRAIAVGTSDGTLEVLNPSADLTITSATSGGGNFVKSGPGKLTIPGVTTLNGGAAGVNVSAGTLTAGFGTGGIATLAISASGHMNMANNTIEALTLSNAVGALTIAGGAKITLELNGTTNDSITLGATGTASTSGTVTLNFVNFGTPIPTIGTTTYTLLAASGGLTVGGTTYALGTAPNGFNYQINQSDTLVSVTTTAYNPNYWNNTQLDGSWKTANGNLGSIGAGTGTNWTNLTGGTDSGHTPLTNETVIFSSQTAAFTSGTTITTKLDQSWTVDSLQFTGNPATVTTVNVNAGTGGASDILTISPASTSGGIRVLAGGGIANLGTTPSEFGVVVGKSQTWDIDPSGSLIINADVNFGGFAVNKTNTGAVTLAGNNTGAGTITLSGGTLNINSATALGSTALVINPGAAIDNTSAAGVTLSTTTAQTWNGDFSFTGSNNLNLGPGSVTLVANVAILANGSAATLLTVGGVIDDGASTFALTKNGPSTLALTNANTFGGGVNMNAGTLNIGNLGALGAGTFTISGGTIDNTSGVGGTLSGSQPTVINGSFAFTGTNSLNLGTGAVTLGTTPTITTSSAASMLTIGGNIAATANGLTKSGPGALTLPGTNNYTGNTTVNGGTLNITGSILGNNTTSALAYGAAAGKTIVNLSGTLNAFKMTGADVAGAATVFNQTAGTSTIIPTNGLDVQWVAQNAGYGALNITGGTFNTGRFDVVGATGGGVGVVYVGGAGTFNNNVGDSIIISQANGTGEITVGPGGNLVRGAAVTNSIGVTMGGTNSTGTLNIAGGTLDSGIRALQFGFGTSAASTGNKGFVNLAGGTLSVGLAVSEINTAGATAEFFNFAGGTLKLNAALASFIPATSIAGHTSISTIFGAITNNNNANTVFNTQIGTTSNFIGGLPVNTNGFTTTFANVFNGATGVGVTQADIGDVSSRAGNSGYIGAPAVTFSNPAAAGADPASGYAVIDPATGKVTGIIITNPGVYAASEIPTITLAGGGGTIAPFATTALATANVSGGLTKTGVGTLVLSNPANSFADVVTILQGTLQSNGVIFNIGLNSPIGRGNATSTATNAASLVLDGGIYNITNTGAPVAMDRLFTVTQNGGGVSIDNGTQANLVTFNNTNAIAYTGSGVRTLTFGGAHTGASAFMNTFAPLIGDAGADAVTVTKTGTAGWLLTNGGNNYTGGTNIAQGFLGFAAGALGSTGNITFTGNSTLVWGTGNTSDISSRLLLTNGVTGTVDTNGNNLVFANAVATTGGTAGVFNKAGAGSLTLNVAAIHTGGTTLTGGTLNLGHAQALGTGLFTVAASGAVIDNTSGSALTQTNNPAQAWNGDFTFTGTNDLNMGTGAVTLGATRTVTNTANTLTVGGAVSGTGFGLTKLGAGTLSLTGLSAAAASNYTGTTIVNAGTLSLTSAGTVALVGGLTFGASAGSTNTGTMDLSGANTTFSGGLSVQNNSASNNVITIGAGKTLTLTGSALTNVVTVGSATVNGIAKLQVTGSTGTLTVNESTHNIVVAGTDITAGSTDLLDLSGLGTFNATSANLYVGRPTTSAGAAAAGRPLDTLILANVNTITAGGNIVIGAQGSQGFLGSGTLNLGTSNALNAATFVVGNGRTGGTVQFNIGLTTPSATLRGAAGGSTRTDIYLGDAANTRAVGSGSSGSTATLGKMDFTAGSVNAMIGSLFLGLGATGASSARGEGNGTFIMDGATSVVDINTLVLAQNTNDATAATSEPVATTSTGVFTIKNGSLVVNTAVTLANDIDASATANGTQNVVGAFNLQGGTAAIGSSGTPVNMILGSHIAAGNPGLATATVSLTGGTLNMFGDIKEGTLGSGTITSLLTLDGATLDMKGHSIGLSGALIDTLTFASGTLTNLSELNSGGALTKTTAGTLFLKGANNSYTGQTIIQAGTVQADVGDALATNSQSLGKNTDVTLGVALASSGTLSYIGSAAGTLAKNINAVGNGNDTVANNGGGALTLSGTLTKNGTTLTLNAASNAINVTGNIVGGAPNSDLIVAGNFPTTISSTGNTFTGSATVNTGATLAVTGSLSGTTGVTNNGTLQLNSSTNASNIIGANGRTGDVGSQSASGSNSTVNYTGATGSTLAVSNVLPAGVSNSFGTLTLSGNTFLDFASRNTNNNFFFTGLGGTTLAELLAGGGNILTINNWNIGNHVFGSGVENGNFGDGQSRLLFTSNPGFGTGVIAGINFTGFGAGAQQVPFGNTSMFEIVPVPEPATTALIGSVALCAIFRARRRFTGIGPQIGKK